ncbi:HD domain-containing protein [Streptomyces platensis]|uniref:HD domain-containing protein n=1 Tax=Streptomyces platensis TaxID=58346 RepID=UPI002E80179B|nr:HD domain-containing protein [Streptomyces platensis]WUB78579.1 HD domain-containing protein [Streptomyces platensis]
MRNVRTHSCGVLALVAHFRPEDELLRVAALLHDIGNLPLSHTLEGVAGLDHHAIGVQLVQSDPIRPVLEKHVRRLARQLLDSAPLAPARLARMTDPQLWTAFDSCAVTQAESTMVRYELHRLKVEAGSAPPDRSGWTFSLRKIYSSAPLVEGQRIEVAAPEPAAELNALRALPTTFRVWWS